MLRRGRRFDGMKGFFSVLILLAGLFWGIDAAAQTATNREITVSAAISLKNAVEDIGKGFREKNPEVTLLFNFGASGDLARQIEAGAPVDIFASAGQKDMNDIDRKGLLAANSRKDFARNTVVLIKPVKSTIGLSSLKDLLMVGVKRVAVGNPKTVPAGRYAEEALKHFHLWEALKDKLVFAENVRQVLDYVARNEADAGLVYSTDAVLRTNDVKVVEKLPADSHQPVIYPIGVIKGTKEEPLARAFVDSVISLEGQKILDRYGFITIFPFQ
jgi:molybdate transport system substrate-binding protein